MGPGGATLAVCDVRPLCVPVEFYQDCQAPRPPASDPGLCPPATVRGAGGPRAPAARAATNVLRRKSRTLGPASMARIDLHLNTDNVLNVMIVEQKVNVYLDISNVT